MEEENYSHWDIRKFCSRFCKEEYFKKILKKAESTFGRGEHNNKLLMINKFIKGELIPTRSNISEVYFPDIIKGENEFELEIVGHGKVFNTKKKRNRRRFDGKIPKKRIIIISIPDKLKRLFDEFYFLQSKKSMEEFTERYGEK